MLRIHQKDYDWHTHSFVALAIGGAGLLVAVAITVSGGLAVRFVPAPVFLSAAFFGAAFAGLFFAGAFGRTGWIGAASSIAAAIVMTLVGAELGAAIALQVGAASGLSGPGLGVLTVFSSVAQPLPIVVWLAAMPAVHAFAARLRRSV